MFRKIHCKFMRKDNVMKALINKVTKLFFHILSMAEVGYCVGSDWLLQPVSEWRHASFKVAAFSWSKLPPPLYIFTRIR